MDGTLWRICALGILCVVVGVIVRQVKSEFLPLLRIAGVVLIFGVLVPELAELVLEVSALFSESGVGPYASVMIRALGIALLTKICCDVCRDTGEGSIAGGVELAGKVAILALCAPMIGEILGYASEILNGK